MNSSLLFALLTILLMCGFQERLFDMARCVSTGTALSISSCIVYGLSMGDFDLVMYVHYFTFGGVESHFPKLFLVCKLSWSV